MNMNHTADDNFYNRADEHINLSNEQLKEISRGKVSASMMYAVARFNAWVSASGFENPEQMQEAREDTIKYFIAEYKKMLEDNLDDYIENFNKYMASGVQS